MSTPQQFSLKWNNYSQHIVTAFEDLRGEDDFTDVTLSCEGKRIKAHKVLLSACSAYFKETFRENPCKHPVIILKNVDFTDLQAVVTFMYNGQVNISQERLSTFLQTAELLQIKGLTEMNDSAETSSSSKKRSHASTSDQVNTNVSQKSTSDDLITPEITTVARPPTPKRKKIGPASFMQMQQNQSQSDSQVPATTQSGSFHSNSRQTSNVIDTSSDSMNAVAGPSGVSTSTGGFINPETVIIPSSNMIDPSATQLSSSNESYSHGIIKFEEEDLIDEDDDYDKTNMSEDNDNSIHDMLGHVEHEQNSMGSYMAGTSGQGIKIVSVGSDSTSHGWRPIVDDTTFTMCQTRGGNPKLIYENFSYMLNSKNKSGIENWRCLRTKICHGRLSKRPGEFRILAEHSVKCYNGNVSNDYYNH